MIALDDMLAGWIDLAIRLLAAVACAGLIGWERESDGRAAGLRTNIMVGLGAAAFTILAFRMTTLADVDPARMVGAIVGGIGFLGAGSIIKSGGQVRGLTTAAGLWVVAALGIACGLGVYDVALFVSILALFTLTAARQLERRLLEQTDGLSPEGE